MTVKLFLLYANFIWCNFATQTKTINGMKKFLLIIGIMISLFTTSSFAGQTRTEIYTWGHDSIRNGRERSSACLPIIDIVYDSNSKSIEIISSMDCEATVFIYDTNGNLIDLADSLDVILSVAGTNSLKFIVRIESDLWYATATIVA